MNTRYATYKSLDNSNIFELINTTREGVDYETFDDFSEEFPLNLSDWSRILNVSERTIQRYKKDNRKFDSIHSEKLLQVMLLFHKGIEVFGSSLKFIQWIGIKNIALGGVKPKQLLDNSFGISLVKDELIRIEHGILA